MERIIEINGRKFKAAEITFGTIRAMERLGVDFNNLNENTFGLISAYVSVSTHLSQEAADHLINEHIVNGGNFNDIMEAFKEQLDDSSFFRTLTNADQTEA